MSRLLAMFAKHWTPGQVKTRLAATLGNEKAAAIHRLFVQTLAARFGNAGTERAIVFAPAAEREAFEGVVAGQWTIMPQVDGDLGQRMRAFFEEALSRAECVMLIGSDSPDVPIEFVERAFAALESCDVVLGPANDGGYYLVGAARCVPQIFSGIDWGTEQVWRQTIERLRAANCNWHELPEWYDVDDERGLEMLLGRLTGAAELEAPLARLRRELQALLSGERAV